MQNGFVYQRTKGSHHVYKDQFGRSVVVVEHAKKDITVGALKDIIRRSGIPQEMFTDKKLAKKAKKKKKS